MFILSYNGGVILKHLPHNKVLSLVLISLVVFAAAELKLSALVCFLQVKMLQSLGLKSTLITDGSSPINLFTTANGLLGALPGQGQAQ